MNASFSAFLQNVLASSHGAAVHSQMLPLHRTPRLLGDTLHWPGYSGSAEGATCILCLSCNSRGVACDQPGVYILCSIEISKESSHDVIHNVIVHGTAVETLLTGMSCAEDLFRKADMRGS